MSEQQLPPVDAVLLLSFGGPEKPEDVLPFLENVTRGRDVPRARLEAVAAQYMRFGGRSPINDQCRRLLEAIRSELAARGSTLPVFWGNRNWSPLLADTVREMQNAGVRRAVAIATSAFSSYSGCRQYLEDIDRVRAEVGAGAPAIEKIPPYWDTPGFLEVMIEHTRAAVAAHGAGPTPRLVFTAHSLPLSMAERCRYVDELRKAAAIVADRVLPGAPWDLAYQSRSGSPSQPWLEPDVGDLVRAVAAQGVTRVVLVPIGFVADHMEVVYDLDVLAREAAEAAGVTMTRAATVGAAPRFVAGLCDLVELHIADPRACAVQCCV